ncbi:hypothetical protein F5880DRAFT_1481435 [Lentinula raphanica]|nr:hypothetical protein F5880DRAFT_1481435 [Lentinula raphanica]
MSALGLGGVSGLTIDSSTSSSSPSTSAPGSVAMAIDPQLVGSPSTNSKSDFGDAEDQDEHSGALITDDEQKPQSPSTLSSEDAVEVIKEKLTVTITPVKVGGHGKARKGTVQSGGVTKKTSTPAPTSNTKASQDKDKDKDDDDDLPADWRPPPEVFAKMSSKEKRQLRNKISARNFRVRRKEYISTLEMDIAERDRLLQAIRSELGSTQSENLALRQEVAALKKALLEGRVTTGLTIDDLNLPPPAPLPERSAAEELALRATAAAGVSPASSSTLLVPNTHKDLPTSPRLNNTAGFWGGVSQAGFGFGGMGSGYTPVHTVLMPDLNTNLNVGGTNMSSPRPLQENINPVMNVPGAHQDEHTSGSSAGPHSGFEGFVDTNPFTMKTLDAYRMQLWTKMAASSSQAPHSNHSSPPVPSPQSSHSNNHSSAYAQQRKALEREMAAASPFTLPSHQPGTSPTKQQQQQQMQQAQTAVYAALASTASQTLMRRLGNAFWDAFSGSSAPSSSQHGAHSHMKPWDADKVRKVLEGKAVIKVVDVDEPVQHVIKREPMTPMHLPSTSESDKCCSTTALLLLEESMRSLTVSKK